MLSELAGKLAECRDVQESWRALIRFGHLTNFIDLPKLFSCGLVIVLKPGALLDRDR